MKRITIRYGGADYTVAHTDLDEIKALLLSISVSGTPQWLTVNHGEGSFRETELLITPGSSIAVTGIDAD